MSTAVEARVDEYRCAQCGATTTFSPSKAQLVCDHCGHGVAIYLREGVIVSYDLFGPAARESLAAAAIVHAGREIECKECGARMIVSREAERCAFCDAPVIVAVDAKLPGIPPGGVLPFVLDAAQAADIFATWMRRRWFAPRDLIARSSRDRMDGIYLPFWIFDTQSVTGYVGQKGTVEDRSVTWQPASGTVRVTRHDVLVSATPSVPQTLVDKLEPWRLDWLRVFDDRFLAGFTAERYRVEAPDGFTTGYPIVEKAIRHAIERDIGGDWQRIDSMSVQWDYVRFRHVLLPIWLSAFRYRGKVFRVVVNAMTGDVYGERPYSAAKICLFILAMVVLPFVIGQLYVVWGR